VGIRGSERPSRRADLIIYWCDHLIPVEIKGYENATKQAAIGQCQIWIDEVEALFEVEKADWTPEMEQYLAVLEKLGLSTELSPEGTVVRPEKLQVKG
jgi:hypothetical protein